jgi:hypothetical protein
MVLLDLGLKILLPGANDSVNLLAVLDEEEGRHGLDFVFRSNFLFGQETVLVHCHRTTFCLAEFGFTVLTFSSSISTFRKTAPGYFLANSTKTGAMKRQGPHQEAVKSMTT